MNSLDVALCEYEARAKESKILDPGELNSLQGLLRRKDLSEPVRGRVMEILLRSA